MPDDFSRQILSVRQCAVAEAVSRGCSNLEIARELDVSFSTIKRQVEIAMTKWNVPNRSALAAEFAHRRAHGLMPGYDPFEGPSLAP